METYTVMGIAFLVLVPMAVGALTIYLTNYEDIKSRRVRILKPWLPVLIFTVLTLLFEIEGQACWIMAFPLFAFSASVGGLIAGHFKLKNNRPNTYVSLMALLPFFISPIEQAIAKIPGRYKADTYIDIQASPQKIWSNVTRVRTIADGEQRSGLTKFLGFPQPLRAELNYEGVGAFRKAVFDKGLVFNETVVAYQPQQKMVFAIQANPYEIPSATMDEHVVVGGNYFDVLTGTYELVRLNDSTCRLQLYSYFKLNTTFNFYASWWAGWIMKDIQNNILHVIKRRAEEKE